MAWRQSDALQERGIVVSVGAHGGYGRNSAWQPLLLALARQHLFNGMKHSIIVNRVSSGPC